MSSYINLIRPAEIKYHSVATDKRLLLRMGTFILLIFGLYAGWTGWQAIQRANEAKRIQDEWARVQPLYAEAEKNAKAVTELRLARDYLKSWGGTRLPMAELLLTLADLLPPEVQMTQVQVTSQLIGLDSSGAGQNLKNLKAPQRQYVMHIKGIAYGKSSEKTIFQFLEDLKSSESLAQWVSLVRLQDTQTEHVSASPPQGQVPASRGSKGGDPPDAVPATSFSIECEFNPRAFAWPGKH